MLDVPVSRSTCDEDNMRKSDVFLHFHIFVPSNLDLSALDLKFDPWLLFHYLL